MTAIFIQTALAIKPWRPAHLIYTQGSAQNYGHACDVHQEEVTWGEFEGFNGAICIFCCFVAYRKTSVGLKGRDTRLSEHLLYLSSVLGIGFRMCFILLNGKGYDCTD